MAKIHPICPLGSLDRTMTDREGHAITLLKGHHLSPRLHPRPLFGQDEFAPSKVLARLRKQKRDLNGKDVLPIDILVKSAPVSST